MKNITKYSFEYWMKKKLDFFLRDDDRESSMNDKTQSVEVQ